MYIVRLTAKDAHFINSLLVYLRDCKRALEQNGIDEVAKTVKQVATLVRPQRSHHDCLNVLEVRT